MLNVETTSALYLFSALLQADAAMLGLGAIVLIFRFERILGLMRDVKNELEKNTDEELGIIHNNYSDYLERRYDRYEEFLEGLKLHFPMLMFMFILNMLICAIALASVSVMTIGVLRVTVVIVVSMFSGIVLWAGLFSSWLLKFVKG